MQKNISFLELACLVKEIQFLVNAKVDKIYVKQQQELLIHFHLPNQGKQMLRIFPPHLLYLTEYRIDTPEKPSRFCQFLRKQLENTRLQSISQIGSERIAAFTFQTKQQQLTLYIEFFSKGNLILCDQENTILTAYDQQQWRERTLKVGFHYSYPKKQYNFFTLTKQELSTLLHTSDKQSIVKVLALDLGLGGLYAEELCLRARLNKNKKHLEQNEIAALFAAINHFQQLPINAFLVEEVHELVPFELYLFEENNKKNYPTFNQLLDTELTKMLIAHKTAELSEKANKKQQELQKILTQQEAHLQKIRAIIDESQQKAEAIYNNYQLLEGILKEINKAREKYSWKEIKERLRGYKLISAVNENENEIVVEL